MTCRIDFEKPITYEQAKHLAVALGFDDIAGATGDTSDYPNSETWYTDGHDTQQVADIISSIGIDGTVCEY